MIRLIGILAGMVWATGALAEETARFDFGGDLFAAGQEISVLQEGIDDLFLGGERLRLGSGVDGSAHVAGRWIVIDGAIGENLYAAGQDVAVMAPVTGDATLAGQTVSLTAPVGGDLRIAGSSVDVLRDVAGSAIIGAEFLRLDGAVTGDLALAAREVDFGAEAQIAGQLILYEETPGTLDVPESVAPADRIIRHEIEEWDGAYGDFELIDRGEAVTGFLISVLIVALIAAVIAALAPETMADMRRRLLGRPGRSLLTGFVALSALAGSGLILALTVIGLLLTPAMVFLSILAGVLGYVVGAYALGVAILSATGRHTPESTGDRALSAGVGALVAGLVGLIPVLGWILVLALVLTGLGAITQRVLRPALFTVPGPGA